MNKEEVMYDCRHFEGHIPCKPNKQFDVQCDNCSHYERSASSITNLDSNESLLSEIYKISGFTKEQSVIEPLKISAGATSILLSLIHI